MVAFSSGSLMRAEWCWGPSARTFVLALALGHLRMAEALPPVAKASPSRAYAGLPRVVDFMEGNRASPRVPMLGAVDAYETRGDKVPPNWLCVLAPLDRHRSFARVLSLQVLEKVLPVWERNEWGTHDMTIHSGYITILQDTYLIGNCTQTR